MEMRACLLEGVVCLWTLVTLVIGMPDNIRIGALFEPEYEGQWRAFEWAVEEVNLKSDLLAGTLVLVDRDTVPPQDSFAAQRKVCRMTQKGIAAMFGPVSAMTAAHVQSMCNAFEIPHLQWRWDPRDKRDYFSISLYPHYLTLSTAYRDVIHRWGWDRFTLLYEDNEGLTRLQEVLKAAEKTPAQITVRKLEMVNNDYLVLLKELQARKEFRFVVDCKVTTVRDFLHAALKLKMISELYHFFFTTLDMGLLDLGDYMHGGANITAYRLIDPNREKVEEVRTSWLYRSKIGDKSPLMQYSEIATETALAYDAYILFAKALHDLSSSQEVNTFSLPCDKVHTWQFGNSLLNYMKSLKFEGLSGTVKYEQGERYDFDLDLLFLTQNGLKKIGKWDRKNGLNVSLQARQIVEPVTQNKVYNVSTYLPPCRASTMCTHGLCLAVFIGMLSLQMLM